MNNDYLLEKTKYFAEMKLPVGACQEFCSDRNNLLHQNLNCRPPDLSDKINWYRMLSLHTFVFRGSIKKIAGR